MSMATSSSRKARLSGRMVFWVALAAIAVGSATASAGQRSIRIITYNVWGLPSPLLVMPSRLKDIAAEMPKLGPDIVAFQETFTNKARVLDRMPGYPYVAQGSPKVKGKLMPAGLTVASRWPIVETRTIVYSDCSGFDCFAAKGALYTRIRIDDVGDVDVFSTHLNAGGKDHIRMSQVAELVAFVSSIAGSRPLIVLGDFNSKPTEAPTKMMLSSLLLRDGHDEYRRTNPYLDPIEWNQYTIDTHRNTNIMIGILFQKPKRIDYVFLRDTDSSATEVESSRLIFDEKVGGRHLSDHFGVAMDLRLTTSD